MIIAVNGEQIADNADLPRIVSRLNPGDKVTLDIIRDGDTEQVEITLGERPTDGRALGELRSRPRSRRAERGRRLPCRAVLQEVPLGQKSLADYTHIAAAA